MRSLRKVTITDVARVAKVSIQTVSAIVNRKPGISEPTRDRVLRAIEQLRYRPNGIASSLRAQRSHTVGVVIPTITNPFFPEFVRGAEDAASEKGYSIFLCNADEDSEKEIQYLWLLQRHRVAGITGFVGFRARGDRGGLKGTGVQSHADRLPRRSQSRTGDRDAPGPRI